MNRSLAPAAVLLVALSAPASLIAQNAPAAQPLPQDPVALLQLASQVNGLHGNDLQPWHIHATWQTLDGNDQPKEQGTWEEWWAGEKKYKTVYKSVDLNRITYGTEKGRYLVGSTEKVPWQFATVERLLQTPVAMIKPTPAMKPLLSITDVQQGPVKLTCALQAMVMPDGNPIELTRQDGRSRQLEFRTCFSSDLPAVRAEETSQGSQTVFNAIVRFQGKYLAKKIRYVGAGGVETDISVDVIEPLDPVVDADFSPAADAVLGPETRAVAVSAGLMAGNRIGGAKVTYPRDALAARVQGTVVLKAHILKDGTIGELTVISGPEMLQKEALDAVKTWRYRPYLLNGEPVEVLTQINVVFQLGGSAPRYPHPECPT